MATRLGQEIQDNGVIIGEDDVSDSLCHLVETEFKTKSNTIKFPEGSFGRLFWRQQEQALETADPEGTACTR